MTPVPMLFPGRRLRLLDDVCTPDGCDDWIDPIERSEPSPTEIGLLTVLVHEWPS